MSDSLLNRSATKNYILKKLEALRPWLKITRVSSQSLEILEARLRNMIISEIKNHPSKGRTFNLKD